MSNIEVIKDSIKKLDLWLEKNNYKAYDPFDGLNARFLRYLTFNRRYLNIALQQSVRRFPLNLRPILGIKRSCSSKAMGYFAKGYLKLYKVTNDKRYLEKTRFCLDWLMQNYSKGYSGYCWGNHFDYQSRVFYLPKGVPTIVWTALIANAFLDTYELLGDQKYLDVARSSCDFILRDLGRFEDNSTVCISYIPTQNKQVHNSNMLAVSLLSRVCKCTKEKELLDLAKKAVAYTIKYQRGDGSWYYGEEKMLHWIDNFHTGYVLDSLKRYIENSGEKRYVSNLEKGYNYYKKAFFLNNRVPKYYNDKVYPIDIQCASQSIETLIYFSDIDPGALNLANRIALWTIKNMQNRSGYFYFRKYRHFANKTPLLHWGQATMFSALTSLLICDERKDED